MQCIMFFDRKYPTKTVAYGEDGNPHQREILEDYYCICSEPGGKYLFHFLNNPEKRGDLNNEHVAQQLYEWITEHELENQLMEVQQTLIQVLLVFIPLNYCTFILYT